MAKYGRLIDTKRCMGCRACLSACAVENHFTPDAPWNVMIEQEVGAFPKVRKTFTTMNCMHCEKPSCKSACDAIGAKAISKNAYGAVLIDYDKCIGCGHCAAVCPYGVPQINGMIAELFAGKGKTPVEALPVEQRHPTHRKRAKTAEKCTFCAHKLDRAIADGKPELIGQAQEYTPSCDLVCPVQARMFGDLDDPQSDISKAIKDRGAVQMKAQFGTGPQVFYVVEEGAKL